MQFQPLGDQAVLVYLSDEKTAVRFAAQVREAAWPWTVDVVQAYQSVAVYYDLATIDYVDVRSALASIESTAHDTEPTGRLFTIPCCYTLGLDWHRLEAHTGRSPEELIALHVQTVYTVYAIGFCPGFPYLGYLPDGIAGVPRLQAPRLQVPAGSVGLTGRQTGIYTEARPGGWNIIGRTPLELVNVRHGYFPLRTGDQIHFAQIGETEFHELSGKRIGGNAGDRSQESGDRRNKKSK